MKRTIFLYLFFLLFASCKKENILKSLETQLEGKWELSYVSCGYCTNPYVPYPAGNGNLLIFSQNNGFERKRNDSTLFKGKYEIVAANDCGAPERDKKLQTTEPNNPVNSIFSVTDSTLFLGTAPCYADGSVVAYRKVK